MDDRTFYQTSLDKFLYELQETEEAEKRLEDRVRKEEENFRNAQSYLKEAKDYKVWLRRQLDIAKDALIKLDGK